MTDLFALKELRDKVAAGTATKRDFILSDLVPHDRSAFRAFNGSLDAAKALHEALLPGWRVEDMHQKFDGSAFRRLGKWQVCIERVKDFVEVSSMDHSPARAWLLAILTALIAQNASND